MKLLEVSLTLCLVLTLSGASPVNPTSPSGPAGPCAKQNQNCKPTLGSFCPQCDAQGNFLPQQCCMATGFCWCADVMTGQEIPGTKTRGKPVNCEKPKEEEEDDDCPDDWSSYEDRCYTFIETPKTWAEAEFYCQFEGANLASVHSDEENHFIQTLTKDDSHEFPETWIGGTNAVDTDFWMWSDGSKVHYENWHDDDNDDEDERCMKINYEFDLKWSTETCNKSLPFVCSMEPEDSDED